MDSCYKDCATLKFPFYFCISEENLHQWHMHILVPTIATDVQRTETERNDILASLLKYYRKLRVQHVIFYLSLSWNDVKSDASATQVHLSAVFSHGRREERCRCFSPGSCVRPRASSRYHGCKSPLMLSLSIKQWGSLSDWDSHLLAARLTFERLVKLPWLWLWKKRTARLKLLLFLCFPDGLNVENNFVNVSDVCVWKSTSSYVS